MRYLLVLEDTGPPDTADVRRRALLKSLLRWLYFKSLVDPRPLPEGLSVEQAWERLVKGEDHDSGSAAAGS